MSSKLMENIQRENGTFYGIHRDIAFPDFHIIKTSSKPPISLIYHHSETSSQVNQAHQEKLVPVINNLATPSTDTPIKKADSSPLLRRKIRKTRSQPIPSLRQK